MVQFLVKKFVPQYLETENPAVRKAYGTLSSVVGIVCNLCLFGVKYLAGMLSGSIAILSDAFNNLSDCASCLVTFFGYKLAAKPADRSHPFGHGRMEYLTSLLIAVLIALMGVERLRDSAGKLLHPEVITFHPLALAILLISIAGKLWLAWFNTRLGKQIQSAVMLASAKDSRNDVLATAATVMVLIAAPFTDLPLDGIMGILVSLFILKTAYDIIKDTADNLLGKPAEPELVQKIHALIRSHEEILGVHDMVIHDYGPGKMIGSCHVEVSSLSNFVAIHDSVDQIEHAIQDDLHMNMTIHMDPIEVDNKQVNACKEMLLQILHNLDETLHIHDFRMVTGESHTNLIFDLVVPFDCCYTDAKLKELIDAALKIQPVTYYTVITFDREYTIIKK